MYIYSIYLTRNMENQLNLILKNRINPFVFFKFIGINCNILTEMWVFRLKKSFYFLCQKSDPKKICAQFLYTLKNRTKFIQFRSFHKGRLISI